MSLLRSAMYGVCMIAPGGFVALAVLATVDKETRDKVFDLTDKAVKFVKNRGQK